MLCAPRASRTLIRGSNKMPSTQRTLRRSPHYYVRMPISARISAVLFLHTVPWWSNRVCSIHGRSWCCCVFSQFRVALPCGRWWWCLLMGANQCRVVAASLFFAVTVNKNFISDNSKRKREAHSAYGQIFFCQISSQLESASVLLSTCVCRLQIRSRQNLILSPYPLAGKFSTDNYCGIPLPPTDRPTDYDDYDGARARMDGAYVNPVSLEPTFEVEKELLKYRVAPYFCQESQ